MYQRHPDAVLLAGATDVGLWITKQFRDLKKIIWLGRVAGLDAISEDAKTLRLGGGAKQRIQLRILCECSVSIAPPIKDNCKFNIVSSVSKNLKR